MPGASLCQTVTDWEATELIGLVVQWPTITVHSEAAALSMIIKLF